MRALLLLLALSSVSLFAQQAVPEIQKPLVTKVTATWCPPCGGWGWDLFEGLVEDNASSAVLMANHYAGSDLETTAGNEIAENFGISGQPTFYLNGVRQSASSGTSATARTNIKAAIDANAGSAPVANATVWSSNSSGLMYTFETTTTFFQAASGEYSLAVYAVEEGVINRQTSRGNQAVHKRVLRGVMTSANTFGELVVDGSVAAGASYSSTFTFDFPSTWELDNIRLVAVLWKKNGTSYDFVNANEIEPTAWVFVSTNTNVLAANDFRITSFSESGVLTTTLDLSLAAQGVSVELVDANGRTLASQGLGNTPSGKTQITWQDVNLSAGVYVVNLRIGNRSRSEKVFVR